eukprot:4998139-Prymnesium_polylepis.1
MSETASSLALFLKQTSSSGPFFEKLAGPDRGWSLDAKKGYDSCLHQNATSYPPLTPNLARDAMPKARGDSHSPCKT